MLRYNEGYDEDITTNYAVKPIGLNREAEIEWLKNLIWRAHDDINKIRSECPHEWCGDESTYGSVWCRICGSHGICGVYTKNKEDVIVQREAICFQHLNPRTVPNVF